ncbi:MAG: glycosyltransferase family 4 protein [Candidatus Methanoperedens sp.]|nr:glycosyltransferase family 4 protein [Candidatus Methanoperedens sp.]MCZ7370290.1 glycosyltransferase family 4 protein [Candidatus Methanoperedens sp.]
MSRKKILVLSFFPAFFPPGSGGELRLYNICRNLAKYYDITILSFTYPNPDRKLEVYKLFNNVIEIRIPKSKLHDILHYIFYKFGHVPECSGAVVSIASNFDSNYKKLFNQVIKGSHILISTHPYLYKKVKDKMVIYESYNMEYYLQKKAFGNSIIAKILSWYVYYIEEHACTSSDMIFAVSDDDINDFHNVYKISLNKIFLAPNGVDLAEIKILKDFEKYEYKKKLGLNNAKALLFFGSAHPPNIDAAKSIIDNFAPLLPEYTFLIAGKVSDFITSHVPNNVRIYGVVDDETKKLLFNASDAALNPMTFGSGTNLKMLDYMAAGLPVITTPTGARGLDIVDNYHAIVCDIDKFEKNIVLLFKDEIIYKKLKEKGRKLVEEKYEWQKIANKMHTNIETYYEKKNSRFE